MIEITRSPNDFYQSCINPWYEADPKVDIFQCLRAMLFWVVNWTVLVSNAQWIDKWIANEELAVTRFGRSVRISEASLRCFIASRA